ncbi:hypothetical protein [Longispora albida]|uniref:hypothetical protein n=1 Tax=Longispora albida TaxID=203523 RepID=UPI00036985D1|nr:hypothetical protein [Longispora albida]
MEPEEEVTQEQSSVETPETPEQPAPPRTRRLPVILGVVSVALLVFGAVMTTLYVSGASDARRDSAAISRQSGEIETLRKQNTELQQRATTAEGKVPDAKGYDLIKACVRDTASHQRSVAEFFKQVQANPPSISPGGQITLPPGVTPLPEGATVLPPAALTAPPPMGNCVEAEKHLK